MQISKLNDSIKTSVSDDNNLEQSNYPEVIAITACPTGIAHTYMAKERIITAAKKLNLSYKIETQGRSGNEDVLTQAEIDNAKVIIFAADKTLTGLNRFQGKKVLEVSTKVAIKDSEKLINDYLHNKVKLSVIKKSENKQNMDDIDFSFKNFLNFKKNMLAGISRMLPFVVAAGIIMGIGFLLDFGTTSNIKNLSDEEIKFLRENYGNNRLIAGWFTSLGKLAISAMLPILGAYVAYAIVGPQGLLPGFVAGLIADAPGILYGKPAAVGTIKSKNWWSFFSNSDLHFNSGFIGALVGAYLAALIVYGLIRGLQKVPKAIAGVRDIVLVPVFSVVAIGLVMFILNIPLGYLNKGISNGLNALSKHSYWGVMAGVLIGLMMSSDMGGPLNKAAYAASLATLKDAEITKLSYNQGTIFMAAAMLTGMVPPLVTAISTLLFPSCWSKRDIEAGRTNWFLSAGFITEGIIPFAVADPKRVISSSLIGSAVTGALSAGFGLTLAAPHGGIFVFPLLGFKNENWLGLTASSGWTIPIAIIIAIAAILIGASIAGTILGLWRKNDLKNGKLSLNRSE